MSFNLTYLITWTVSKVPRFFLNFPKISKKIFIFPKENKNTLRTYVLYAVRGGRGAFPPAPALWRAIRGQGAESLVSRG